MTVLCSPPPGLYRLGIQSRAVVLAADSGSVFAIAFGAFLALCFLVFLFRPRDINGRRRAIGCLLFLVLFFVALVGFLAVWVANDVV